MMLTFVLSISAQTPTQQAVTAIPEKIPLASEEVLKAYALTMVGRINVQVYGSSVQGNSYQSVDYPYKDADPDRMAYVARSQVLRFDATTDDKLTSYISYNSREIALSDGYSTSFALFSGQKEFMLEPQKGGWGVPSDACKVELDYYGIPFVIPGMTDAYIVTKDENGNQNGFYSFRQGDGYWMDRGIIFLTKELVSRNGEFNLVMNNGSRIIYDLGTGNRKSTENVSAGGFNPTIKGIRSVPADTFSIDYEDTDQIIRASYSFLKEIIVQVTFRAGLKRYPVKVSVISSEALAENPNADWKEFNPYIEPVKFSVKPQGTILIRFDHEKNMQPLNNNESGGKG